MTFYTTLDASLYLQGSQAERTGFATDLVQSLQRDGFIKLRNHGIPTKSLDDIFTWVNADMHIRYTSVRIMKLTSFRGLSNDDSSIYL
jgi:isopenicillin N synthase-like dioxygenase